MRGGVFICYRGTDSYSYGALVHVELCRYFGVELVFLDSVSIPAGVDFVDRLLAQVRQSRVFLAVIGPSWLTATNPLGERLIDDPQDWVRHELVEAFAAGVRVIPVLTDGAELPAETDLPADIAGLSRCQYRLLRHRDAAADLRRLRGDLVAADPVLAAAARGLVPTAQRPSLARWAVGLIAAVAPLAAVAVAFTAERRRWNRLTWRATDGSSTQTRRRRRSRPA